MNGNLSIPYSWDSLDKSVLQKSVNLIQTLSQSVIKTLVIEDCKKYFEISSIPRQNVSIIKHKLLGVEGAAIIAQFKKYPKRLYDGVSWIAGIARPIQVEGGILPVVLLFPTTNKTILEHESIHLCQWLNSQSYLFTLDERIDLLQQNIEIVIKNILTTNPEQALDSLIRLICYMVWTELEANYCTSVQYVLDAAQRSSEPFTTFEAAINEWGIGKDIPNAMDRCVKEFTNFCNELESHIEWVRELVANSGSKTLHEALYWHSEVYETEKSFDPTTEDEQNCDEDVETMRLLGLSEDEIKFHLLYRNDV